MRLTSVLLETAIIPLSMKRIALLLLMSFRGGPKKKKDAA